MKRRPIVAGRGRVHSDGARGASKSKSDSKRSVIAGIVIPVVAIVTAFFTAPVYDKWQDFRLMGEPAIKAEVRQELPGGSPDVGYLLPMILSPQQIESLQNPPPGKFSEKVVQAGGVPVVSAFENGGENIHRVDLIGNRRERVRISDMHVRVLERKPVPKEATLVRWKPQGGGDVDKVRVDLDKEDGGLRAEASGRLFLDEQFRYVEKGEPISLGIAGSTQNCWCSWELVVDVAYDDKKETIVVRSDGTVNGPPFQTVAWGGYRDGELSKFASEYEISLVDGEWVNCVEAMKGVPAAVRSAEVGQVCGFSPW